MSSPADSERPAATSAWAMAATKGVLRHPSLWATAVVQAGRLAAPGWWRRRPFLPLPDPEYLGFRLQTAYGDPGHPPEPEDLVTYLRWCRAWPGRSLR